MRPGRDLPGYDVPFYLFGNARHAAARSLTQLVTDGVLASRDALDLIEIARSDISLVVIAHDAAAGKSSLLASLLPYIPRQRRPYFLRGSFETFRFTREADWRPGRALLIANEVGDRLPVYLPGCRFATVLQLVGEGARLWTTAHAHDVRQLLAAWTGWPAHAPLAVVTVSGAKGRIVTERHDGEGSPSSRLESRRAD